VYRHATTLITSMAATLIVATTPLGASAAPASLGGPDTFIVVLRDGVDSDRGAREQAARHQFAVSHVYGAALNGYAARMRGDIAERLKADPEVLYVTPDVAVHAPPQRGPSETDPSIVIPGGPFVFTQKAPTGVARVGASSNGKTQTLANNGAGVNVAILDTGIQQNHPDLKPVQNGKNCQNPSQPAEDDNGHGTHVSGTIAGRDNSFGVVGVAPSAGLIAVKVLDAGGNGSFATVICGIDWVTANAAAKNIKIANMSLGGAGTVTASSANCSNSNSDALHTAICKSVKAGVTYVVAAGNDGSAASGFVPAGYSEVIAVSAWSDTNGKPDATGPSYTCPIWGLQTDEQFATGTNWGAAVDIGAPGVGIRSTVIGSTYATWCGTSMAAPHASGAAALVLNKWPSLTPSEVKAALKENASPLANTLKHVEDLLKVSSF
jgi:subtilisin